MTPEMLVAALRQTLPEALRAALPVWYTVGLSLLITAVVAAGGAYLGSYLQARAQRRAVKDTLDEIERKTEEIKAEVSGGLWLLQKRWDLRREVYSQLLVALDDLYNSLRGLALAHAGLVRLPSGAARDAAQKVFEQAVEQLVSAHAALSRAKAVGEMLLLPEAVAALESLRDHWNPLAAKLEKDGASQTDVDDMTEITARVARALVGAARRDLLEEEGSRG